MVYKKPNQCYGALGASVNICSAWQENHKNVKNAINVDIKFMAATAGGVFLPPRSGRSTFDVGQKKKKKR